MGSKRVVAGSLLAVASIATACGGGPAATQAPSATGATGTPSAATAAPATQAPATQAAATADPFALIAGLEGTFSGSWKNTTFGSTGTAAVDVTFDRATTSVKLKLTLGGNVFGNPAPAPEELTAVITPGQGAMVTSSTFGPTTLTAALVGGKLVITMTSPDVPSARIKTFTSSATLNGTTIDLTYEVTFRDTTPAAQGTGTLSKG
jgi:hypothetical protein